MHFHEGQVLDGFTLEKRMPSGGMASLWRAHHPDVDVPVVLKIPFLDPGQDVSTVIGYEVEELILKRLSGPHVPRYIGSGDLAFSSISFVRSSWSSEPQLAPMRMVLLFRIAISTMSVNWLSRLFLKPTLPGLMRYFASAAAQAG